MHVRTCHSTDVSKYKLALKELEVERIHALEGMRPHALGAIRIPRLPLSSIVTEIAYVDEQHMTPDGL
jgi:hypothetical protein